MCGVQADPQYINCSSPHLSLSSFSPYKYPSPFPTFSSPIYLSTLFFAFHFSSCICSLSMAKTGQTTHGKCIDRKLVESAKDSEHLNQGAVRMEEDPPFEHTYKDLLEGLSGGMTPEKNLVEFPAVEECQLPLIDLSQLSRGESERRACKEGIAQASKEWGFFQVMNHGISSEVLDTMRREQVKLFRKPFHEKANCTDLNFSAGSYRWGTPSATSLNQLAWSEAFHVSLRDVLGLGLGLPSTSTLSSIMEQYAVLVSDLSLRLASILAEQLGQESHFFREACLPDTCYLRLNRYPPCPGAAAAVFGIMPHTDSDFVTVLHQDGVGGLQLVRDGRWFSVRPDPQALIINVGDLFQAWSNGAYRSVEHRVVASPDRERFSSAYFFCPAYDSVVDGGGGGSGRRVYKRFTFGEYRRQVQEDVRVLGHKVGLSRFLVME